MLFKSRGCYTLLTLVVGFSVTVFLFYPGIMDMDAVWYLEQAYNGDYSDWMPPFGAWFWRALIWFTQVPGPGALFLWTVLVFWAGLVFYTFSVFKNTRWAMVSALLIGFSPVILGFQSQMWKDTFLMAHLMLAVGLWVRGNRRLSLLPILLASFSRYNAFLITGPLLSGFLNYHKPRNLWKAGLVTVTLWFLAFGVNQSIFKTFSGRKSESVPAQQIYLYDLASLSIRNNQNFLESHYKISLDHLRKIYTPYGITFLWDPSIWFLNPKEANDLRITWIKEVKNHFADYLAIRAALFWRLLIQCEPKNPWSTFYTWSNAISFQSKLQRFESAVLLSWSKSVWVQPIFYLILWIPIMIFSKSILKIRTELFMALTLSSFFYLLAYLFIGFDTVFRYVSWLFLSTELALALCVAQIANKRKF